MSTAELIYEKAKSLPGKLQSEALDFLEYLARRRAASSESVHWESLLHESQSLPSAQRVTDAEIAAEIAAYRAGR